MDVYGNNNIQFCSQHIMTSNVLKKVGQNMEQYLPQRANIVELDYRYAPDKKVAQELCQTWKGAEFMNIIASSSTSPTRRIYAITVQNSDYEHLDASKILGIADFELTDRHAKTRFLQAKPDIISQKCREIKGIGRFLMKGIVSHLKNLGFLDMSVFVRQSEKSFYRTVFPEITDKISTSEDTTNMILKL